MPTHIFGVVRRKNFDSIRGRTVVDAILNRVIRMQTRLNLLDIP